MANYGLIRRATAAFVTGWVSETKVGWGIGLGGGYAAYRAACKYTPQLMQRAMALSARLIPFPAWNKYLETTVTPLLQQKMATHIVPVAASLAAFSGLYVAVVIANLVNRIFKNPSKTP